MKVVVDSVLGARVIFRSACGVGEAGWLGPPVGPGDEREVELEIDGVLEAGIDLVPCDEPVGIRRDGAGTTIVGQVVAVDESYLRLDLGCGALDLDVHHASTLENKVCRLTTRALRLFDARL